jgi:hypothetical protein
MPKRTDISSILVIGAGPIIIGQALSVHYHPEANPGPQDSFYMFERFVAGLGEKR